MWKMEFNLDHRLQAALSPALEIVSLIDYDCSKQEREQKEDDQPVMWVLPSQGYDLFQIQKEGY